MNTRVTDFFDEYDIEAAAKAIWSHQGFSHPWVIIPKDTRAYYIERATLALKAALESKAELS